ncbi:MAG: hypothetical protein Q8K78_15120 [Planctomycetaceae bacterium]|nr:hypothetical protein [Planctomycetaceae bacterium]
MSFHEKSAWVCLVSILCVYLPYFSLVCVFPMAALGLFWVAVAGLVVLLTVFHVVIAVATRSVRTTGGLPPVDELDEKIELKATKWASLILAFAVFTWVLVAMYSAPVIAHEAFEQAKILDPEAAAIPFAVPVFTAMAAIQWLFAGCVFANVIYYGGIVIGYRSLAGE